MKSVGKFFFKVKLGIVIVRNKTANVFFLVKLDLAVIS